MKKKQKVVSRIDKRKKKQENAEVTKAKKSAWKRFNRILYVINDLKFGDMEVRTTARAWWQDKHKLEAFIDAKKIGATDEEACGYAGILKRQIDYFLEVHEHFREYFDTIKVNPKLRARQTVYNNLDNPDMAWKYLEKAARDEFGTRHELTGANGAPLIPKPLSKEQVKAIVKGAKAMIEGHDEGDGQ